MTRLGMKARLVPFLRYGHGARQLESPSGYALAAANAVNQYTHGWQHDTDEMKRCSQRMKGITCAIN